MGRGAWGVVMARKGEEGLNFGDRHKIAYHWRVGRFERVDFVC